MEKKPVVIIDTNVFISGLLSPKGTPGAILVKFRQSTFSIVTSKEQVQEVRRVLKRPALSKLLSPEVSRAAVKFFLSFNKLTTVMDPPKQPWEFKDVGDHFLLDLAVYSKADFLVIGDKALQTLLLIGRCAVVSPSEFLGRL